MHHHDGHPQAAWGPAITAQAARQAGAREWRRGEQQPHLSPGLLCWERRFQALEPILDMGGRRRKHLRENAYQCGIVRFALFSVRHRPLCPVLRAGSPAPLVVRHQAWVTEFAVSGKRAVRTPGSSVPFFPWLTVDKDGEATRGASEEESSTPGTRASSPRGQAWWLWARRAGTRVALGMASLWPPRHASSLPFI